MPTRKTTAHASEFWHDIPSIDFTESRPEIPNPLGPVGIRIRSTACASVHGLEGARASLQIFGYRNGGSAKRRGKHIQIATASLNAYDVTVLRNALDAELKRIAADLKAKPRKGARK